MVCLCFSYTFQYLAMWADTLNYICFVGFPRFVLHFSISGHVRRNPKLYVFFWFADVFPTLFNIWPCGQTPSTLCFPLVFQCVSYTFQYLAMWAETLNSMYSCCFPMFFLHCSISGPVSRNHKLYVFHWFSYMFPTLFNIWSCRQKP